MRQDEYRPIPGYGGLYEVNSFGEVRSWKLSGSKSGRRAERPSPLKAHARKQQGTDTIYVSLNSPGHRAKNVALRSIMRDVWMQGKIPGKRVVPKDGNPWNCCLSNLVYVDAGDAFAHRYKWNRKPVAQIDAATGGVIHLYTSVREAGKAAFLTPRGMSHRIASGRVHDGVKWVFMKE